MSPEPNSEIKLRLSAYIGNILLFLIVGVTICLILNAGLANMGRLPLFFVLLLFLILYLVKIKKTIVIFGNDGNLSVESG